MFSSRKIPSMRNTHQERVLSSKMTMCHRVPGRRISRLPTGREKVTMTTATVIEATVSNNSHRDLAAAGNPLTRMVSTNSCCPAPCPKCLCVMGCLPQTSSTRLPRRVATGSTAPPLMSWPMDPQQPHHPTSLPMGVP